MEAKSDAGDEQGDKDPKVSPPALILLVDDDPDIREALAMVLEIAGHTVVAASNGAQALELLRRTPLPRVILLDLMMPVMDGLTFLREARANPAWRDIPVVVMTAKDLTTDEIAGIQASVARVMTKHGHSLEDVLAHVVSLVRG